MDGQSQLTPAARLLGYAGLLSQILCVGLAASGSDFGYTAIAGGFAYAAAIFSFLGGVWWGQAIAKGKADAGVFLIAVMPSLIAVALFLPWTFGWEWPAPALYIIGALIAASPFVDRALGLASRDFMRLRIQLSIALGVLTIALGGFAQAMMRVSVAS